MEYRWTSEETPVTTQPTAARAEDVAAAQIPLPRTLRPPGAPAEKDQEQFLGMLVIRDLRDREGHRLMFRLIRNEQPAPAKPCPQMIAADVSRDLKQPRLETVGGAQLWQRQNHLHEEFRRCS